MRLLDRAAFEFRESDFPVDAQNPCSLLAGEPAEGRPVRMLHGPSGRAWRAQRAGHPFTVTVEDGHSEVLSRVLRHCSRLPLPYLAALEIVSEAGEDGLALYQSLGGAAGHGSNNYVNVINSSLPLLLHGFGHAIEQQARKHGNAGFLDEWARAIGADAVDVSAYALHNAWEDCTEFSLLYAIASTHGALEQLGGHSPERLRLWSWALEQVNGPLHPEALATDAARLEALATPEALAADAEAARLEALDADAKAAHLEVLVADAEAARLEALAADARAARLEALAADARAARLATEAARLEALATEAACQEALAAKAVRLANEAATPTAREAAEQPVARSRARAPPPTAALAVLALALIVALLVALVSRSTPNPS